MNMKVLKCVAVVCLMSTLNSYAESPKDPAARDAVTVMRDAAAALYPKPTFMDCMRLQEKYIKNSYSPLKKKLDGEAARLTKALQKARADLEKSGKLAELRELKRNLSLEGKNLDPYTNHAVPKQEYQEGLKSVQSWLDQVVGSAACPAGYVANQMSREETLDVIHSDGTPCVHKKYASQYPSFAASTVDRRSSNARNEAEAQFKADTKKRARMSFAKATYTEGVLTANKFGDIQICTQLASQEPSKDEFSYERDFKHAVCVGLNILEKDKTKAIQAPRFYTVDDDVPGNEFSDFDTFKKQRAIVTHDPDGLSCFVYRNGQNEQNAPSPVVAAEAPQKAGSPSGDATSVTQTSTEPPLSQSEFDLMSGRPRHPDGRVRPIW